MKKPTFFRTQTISMALLGLFFISGLQAAEYGTAVTSRLITKAENTSNGDKIKYPAFSNPEVSALEVDIAPGAETGWHKHPVPVYAYVLAGKLLVDIEGGKSQTFKPGDAIIEVVDAWHNGRNISCEPVRLAVFYLGGKDVANVAKSPKHLGQNSPTPVLDCPAR